MRKLTAVGFGLAVATFGFSAFAEDAPKAAPADAPAASASTDSGIPISIGLRVGYALALGNAAKDSPMSDSFKGAIPFTLDALFRVTRAFRVGLYGSYAIVSLGDAAKRGADLSGSWLKYGLELQYHLSPEASMNPWVGYGIGLENVKASGSVSGITVSNAITGIEFAHLMAGLDFKATSALSVGPFVDFSLGQYSSTHAEINGTEIPGTGGDIKDKAMHMWLYLGLRGNYDLLSPHDGPWGAGTCVSGTLRRPRAHHEFGLGRTRPLSVNPSSQSRLEGENTHMRKLTAFGFGLAVATFGWSAFAEDAPKVSADAPAHGGKEFGDAGVLNFAAATNLTLAFGSIKPPNGGDSGSTSDILVQPSIDYFVIQNLSIGALVGLELRSQKTPPSTDADKSTTIRVGPRLGYNIWITPGSVGLWPKIGFLFETTSFNSQGKDQGSESRQVIGIDLPFLIHPVHHFHFGIGPFVEMDIAAKTSPPSGPSADGAKATVFGLRADIAGWL